MKAKPELKAECLRLRFEERLSNKEIRQRTGAAAGSISTWLRKNPLTKEERRFKSSVNRRGGNPKKPRGDESPFHRMVVPKASRLQKAKIAEAAVLFRMTLCGFNVFGSPFDGDKADWIVEVPETKRIVKVQVKWASEDNKGRPGVRLVCVEGHNRRRSYREGELDFIIGYDLYTDTCYVWSWGDVAHLKSWVTVSPQAKEAWDKMRT